MSAAQQAALADTPLRLVRLPTYAPVIQCTDPVEKVWRNLYAETLHLHRLAAT